MKNSINVLNEHQMSWSKYFFNLCDVISTKSKDPSTKIGCVIADSQNAILSTGFNGFPIGVKDELFYVENDKIDMNKRYHDRELKLMFTAHAEENAIAMAARNGVSLKNSSIYLTGMPPCSRCTRLIIQSGIKRIFVLQTVPDETLKRWENELKISKQMIDESSIDLIIIHKS